MATERFTHWYKDARERVLATAVYLAGAIASVQLVIDNTGLLQQEWQQFTAIGLVALGLNLIKVVAALSVGENDTAAMTASPTKELDSAPEVAEESPFPETDEY